MAKEKKKIITNVEHLELGNKVKDITIDIKKYSLVNLIILILLNVLLLAVMIYYICISNNALIVTVAVITVLACVVWSVLSYLKSIIKIKYSIYDNAIIKDFDSSKTIGIYANLKDIKIVQTLIDKLGKNKTYTLVLKFNKPGARKICLYCIQEDVNKIASFIKENQAKAVVVFHEYEKENKTYKTIKYNFEQPTEFEVLPSGEKSNDKQEQNESSLKSSQTQNTAITTEIVETPTNVTENKKSEDSNENK